MSARAARASGVTWGEPGPPVRATGLPGARLPCPYFLVQRAKNRGDHQPVLCQIRASWLPSSPSWRGAADRNRGMIPTSKRQVGVPRARQQRHLAPRAPRPEICMDLDLHPPQPWLPPPQAAPWAAPSQPALLPPPPPPPAAAPSAPRTSMPRASTCPLCPTPPPVPQPAPPMRRRSARSAWPPTSLLPARTRCPRTRSRSAARGRGCTPRSSSFTTP
jgi:hypothetical protein